MANGGQVEHSVVMSACREHRAIAQSRCLGLTGTDIHIQWNLTCPVVEVPGASVYRAGVIASRPFYYTYADITIASCIA